MKTEALKSTPVPLFCIQSADSVYRQGRAIIETPWSTPDVGALIFAEIVFLLVRSTAPRLRLCSRALPLHNMKLSNSRMYYGKRSDVYELNRDDFKCEICTTISKATWKYILVSNHHTLKLQRWCSSYPQLDSLPEYLLGTDNKQGYHGRKLMTKLNADTVSICSWKRP